VIVEDDQQRSGTRVSDVHEPSEVRIVSRRYVTHNDDLRLQTQEAVDAGELDVVGAARFFRSGGRSFGGDPLGRFDQDGGSSRVERSGRLEDVPPDMSCRLAELRTATEQNIGSRASSHHHDQRGPSGVGATAERCGPRYGMDTFAV
jgi:hypothetical protein